jgi:hypothetical protein
MTLSFNPLTATEWPIPDNPVDALEIALGIARDEQVWESGTWFEPSHGTWFEPSQSAPTRQQQLALGEIMPVCTDVKACANGILGIALGNGPTLSCAIGNYEGGALDPKEMVTRTPLGRECAELLGRGMSQAVFAGGLAGRLDQFGDSNYRAAIDYTIDVNDDCDSFTDDDGEYDRKKHHAVIVNGFEHALRIAREEAAKATA